MNIIDRWKERRAEKKERLKYGNEVFRTISVVTMAHNAVWSRGIEIDRSTTAAANKIAIDIVRKNGANAEVCDRLVKFFTDIVANEDNDLKDIRANFDRIIIESQRSRYQYDMILALMRTEPMFRL